MNEHKLKYIGIEITVFGNFYKGDNQSDDYPGDPDVFEIESILIENIEVVDLFEAAKKDDHRFMIDDISEMIIEKYYR